MIRKLEQKDIEAVAKIWLDTNIKAHDFISAKYWEDNFELVKTLFSQAEMYVYESENDGQILGFIGMDDEYIAGLFVSENAQSKGIGKLLMDFMKSKKDKLSLKVYQKNERATKFYLREGFEIASESLDEVCDEKEYFMVWNKQK